jgi:II/X family phage/plasmid replication protein
MIDWVTIRLPFTHFSENEWLNLRSQGDRILRYSPLTGDTVWETQAWESIRSDSHGISYRIGSDAVWVQGSPARVIGDGCNVFGAGPSAVNDLVGCVERMARYWFGAVGLESRGATADWVVSRVDVTGNLLLGSLQEVRDALRILRELEGGRYRVSQQAGDSVYWSHRSRLRSGKAYAKGPHLDFLMRKNRDYTGRYYQSDEIDLANRLLRLELKLGNQFWKRLESPWYEFTPEQIWAQWENYFGRMIGDAEMTSDSELKDRVFAAAPTEGQGRAAYATWALIQSQGWERAREMQTKRTWYRNLKILRTAGLGDADFSCGQVVRLRRKIISAQLVESWDQLRNVA